MMIEKQYDILPCFSLNIISFGDVFVRPVQYIQWIPIFPQEMA